MLDPMRTTQLCQGMCNQIPDEVCEAVFETLDAIPGLYRERDPREALATLVDAAIRSASQKKLPPDVLKLSTFVPFDPAKKTSEATATDAKGEVIRIVKGAFTAVAGLARTEPNAAAIAAELEKKGFRVLAVAAGPSAVLQIIGLIALSDPPRPDSVSLIAELKSLGVRTVMVTVMRRRLRLLWRMQWASRIPCAHREPYPTTSSLRTLRSLRAFFQKVSSTSSKLFKREDILLACAGMGQTMLRPFDKRRSALRFPQRPTWRSQQPVSFSLSRGSEESLQL
jgi:hypothetical protein